MFEIIDVAVAEERQVYYIAYGITICLVDTLNSEVPHLLKDSQDASGLPRLYLISPLVLGVRTHIT